MFIGERHQIGPTHPYWKELDHLAFLSKNLYNSVIYLLRQEYFAYQAFREANKNNPKAKFKWCNSYQIRKDWAAANQPDFRALPAQVAEDILHSTFKSFKSFWTLAKLGKRPGLPKYKDKLKGRNVLMYRQDLISRIMTEQGRKLSRTNVYVPIQTDNKIHQVRIIPSRGCYIIEVVYERYCKKPKNGRKYAAIDLGLNNLATLTFNKKVEPLIIPGGPLKSINQYYNKEKARLQSALPNNKHWSKNLDRLTRKRGNKVSDYLHKASRWIINHLVSQGISTLIIGYNPEWKQGINIGKQTNQNFVSVPFAKFRHMLEYKGKLSGIKVIIQEEAYTSRCSFLDREPIRKHDSYLGQRVKRGLFKSGNGTLINADVNGSYNIMRKAFPNLFRKGIEGVLIHPKRVVRSF